MPRCSSTRLRINTRPRLRLGLLLLPLLLASCSSGGGRKLPIAGWTPSGQPIYADYGRWGSLTNIQAAIRRYSETNGYIWVIPTYDTPEIP